MNVKVMIWIYALLAVCGSVLGVLMASSVRATSTNDVYVNPGASTNALTCGWHDICEYPYTWSNALDWGNDPYTNKYVYWRSWGVVASGSGTMAYGYPYNASSTICYGAGVNLYDTSWGYRGSVVYLHTSLSGSAPTVYVQGSWSGTFTSDGPMGTTVAGEKDVTCPWEAPHLHQYSTASGWWANTEVYPNAVNPQTSYNLAAFGNWQNRTNWTQ
jgi:hypothetical protein